MQLAYKLLWARVFLKFDQFQNDSFVSVLRSCFLKLLACIEFVLTVAEDHHVQDTVTL